MAYTCCTAAEGYVSKQLLSLSSLTGSTTELWSILCLLAVLSYTITFQRMKRLYCVSVVPYADLQNSGHYGEERFCSKSQKKQGDGQQG